MAAMNQRGRIVGIHSSPGGIPKRPRAEAELSERGIAGDDWAHPKYHGGPKQALLLIGEEVLAELAGWGFEVYPGALGENLTTKGLDYARLEAGQQFQIGSEARIELTKLREPCRTLEVYNNVKSGRIQKVLKEAGRGGWYAKVLVGGKLLPGDEIVAVSDVV